MQAASITRLLLLFFPSSSAPAEAKDLTPCTRSKTLGKLTESPCDFGQYFFIECTSVFEEPTDWPSLADLAIEDDGEEGRSGVSRDSIKGKR